MNKSTYNKLKKYEVHLRRGYKGNYVYGLLQKDFDVLYEIYKNLGFKESLKYTCQSCILRLCKTLGKLYYEYDENLMKEPEVSPVISDETKEKKTRGRKKKESQ